MKRRQLAPGLPMPDFDQTEGKTEKDEGFEKPASSDSTETIAVKAVAATSVSHSVPPEAPEERPAPISRMEKNVDTPNEGLREIGVDLVDPSPFQPRTQFSEDGLISLADNLVEVGGLVEPIKVRPKPNGRYELIAGERRLRATHLNGTKTIQAWVKSMSDETAFKEVCAENLNREDLAFYEVAKMLKRLQEEGVATSQRKIASLIGKSLTDVNRYLAIFKFPPAALALLERNPSLIGPSYVNDLAKYVEDGHGEQVTEGLELIQKGRLTSASMISWLEKQTHPRSQTSSKISLWSHNQPIGEMAVRNNKLSIKLVNPENMGEVIDLIKKALHGIGMDTDTQSADTLDGSS